MNETTIVQSAAVVWSTTTVGGLASRPAVTVPVSSTLGATATVMREAGTSSVLVQGGRAILTERDIVRAFEAGYGVEDPVSVATTEHPVRVPADTAIVDAAALMLNQDVRHLVVDLPDGRAAVVSLRDLLAVLLQAVDPRLWLASLRVAVEMPEIWLG